MPKRDLALAPEPSANVDADALIIPSDILRAKAAWRRDAPATFRTLLDATGDGNEPVQ
jgi:hypothetical protein